MRRLGVPYSTATQRLTNRMVADGKDCGIEVVGIEVGKGQFGEALKALATSQCDGVAMIPDPQIYSAGTIQELILWGLRNKKPVWAFSPNVVKAGAYAGQWVEPADVGRQAAEIVQRLRKGEKPERVGLNYPTEIKRAVNRNTADRIGLPFDEKSSGHVTVFGGEP